MQAKNSEKNTKSYDSLRSLLNGYISDAEKGKEKQCGEANETVEKKTSALWSEHFDKVVSDNANDSDSNGVSSHFTDTAPSEIVDFYDNHAETVKEAPSKKTTKKTEKENNTSDDEKKPWYVRLLISVVSFFWNCGFIIKAAVYIVIVLVISAFLSYYIISVGNDVFAFVKSDRPITVEITEGMTRKEVAYLLEKKGVIEYSWAFNLYMIYSGDGEEAFLPGEHEINSQMNYSQILSGLTEEKFEMIQVSVTIPEGFTTDEIIDLFVSKGIGNREGFIDAINNYPFQHEFIRLLEEKGYPESRKYRLEGYLYPDTYYFYTDSEEYVVINKLLNNFDNKFWAYYESTFKSDIDKAGLTFDDIVTLASMIQGEAKQYIDFEYISYVFNNRLKHSANFPYLESDATIQYFLDERTEDITKDQKETANPYNTYLFKGLPPGAICNPGFDALSAAIYPDAPINAETGEPLNAYFFVSNKMGYTYYAETLSAHERNINQVKKDNEEYENQ